MPGEAEGMQDELLVGLLGDKINFSIDSPIMQEIFGMNLDFYTLQRSEELSDFAVQASIEGIDFQMTQPWMTGALQQEQKTPDQSTGVGAAAVGGAFDLGAALLPPI